MINFRTFTAPALAAILAFAPTAAQATNVDAGHRALAAAVQTAGIQVKVNPQRCDDVEAMGWYWASRRELVVCQENATATNVETAWTAEDLDTLRHEAHHLVQDCLDGRIDGRIKPLLRDPKDTALHTLGTDASVRIVAAYTGQGRADAVLTELEAFSIAAINDVDLQTREINQYCAAR